MINIDIWSKTFKTVQFSNGSISGLGKPLSELLDSMAHLRHSAVHRTAISVNRVLGFLIDAERMVTLLEDEDAASDITRLRGTLELVIDESVP